MPSELPMIQRGNAAPTDKVKSMHQKMISHRLKYADKESVAAPKLNSPGTMSPQPKIDLDEGSMNWRSKMIQKQNK